jgi:hypothetical protein
MSNDIENVIGRLEVPSGEEFSVEVWMTNDNPLWKVSIAGKTASGEEFIRDIGEDQSHFQANVAGVPDGGYALVIQATLQDPGALFTLKAKSSVDEESKVLTPIANKPVRIDALPVLIK